MKNSFYSLEQVTETIVPEMMTFLKRHENFCMFLLGNLESHGYKLTDAPNSGNFKIIRHYNSVVAVFCLTRRGNLLVQSEVNDPVFELVLQGCREETNISIGGVLGDWDFCAPFWNFLKSTQVIGSETYTSKEILYSIDLQKRTYPLQQNVRLLTVEDFANWQSLTIAYLKEQRCPVDLSDEQMQKEFLRHIAHKSAWGAFIEGKLVCIAELNARAGDMGQVGGMYTDPPYRRRGIAKSLLQQLMMDVKTIHNLRKLILFTDIANTAARGFYSSLGGDDVGHFALLFGR